MFRLGILPGTFASSMVACMAATLPTTVQAHQRDPVYLDVSRRGPDVRMVVRATPEALAPLFPVVGPQPAAERTRQRREQILNQIATEISLRGVESGVPCTRRSAELRGTDKQVRITLDYRCRWEAADLRYAFMSGSRPNHSAYVTIGDGGGNRVELVRPNGQPLRLAGQTDTLATMVAFGRLGIAHILGGLDHLLFLVALMLALPLRRISRDPPGPAPSLPPHAGSTGDFPLLRGALRELVGLVTAFAVAHSFTLACAALGWLRLPAVWVEPAIALTIAYVGVENWVAPQARRWPLVFLFGLIHGFGFADILQETGLPSSARALSLLAFNLGVELGQIVTLAALYPLLHQLCRRATSRRRALILTSAAALLLLSAVFAGLQGLNWLVSAAAALALLASVLLLRRARRPLPMLRLGSVTICAVGLFWFFERTAALIRQGAGIG